MPYPYDADTLDALDRLDSLYNGDDYDATTNPGGFAHGGHRVNFIPSLRDVATVGDSVADAADAAVTAADQASNYATALFATSTTAMTISTGSKTMTTQASKTFPNGSYVLITSQADPAKYMHGQVTSYSGTSLTVNVTLTLGSGTFNAWNISLSAPQGAQGPIGVTGAPGLAGLRFKWSTSTANTDPTSGFVKMNNAAAASATSLFISETDTNGASVGALLARWDDSTSTVKGTLLIVDSADLTKFISFTISGTITDNGAWDTFTISGGAGTPPANDDVVAVLFIPTGDKGDIGLTGPTGNAGGAITIDYLFSTTTTDADPGNGNLRLSSGTQNISTVIRADLLDVNSIDFTTALDFMDDSTTTLSRGQIRLYKTTDKTKFIDFNLTAVATPSGYRNLTVSVLASSTTNPFANGDPVTLAFSRTGDAGGGAASTITFTPTGGIAATDVQAALAEVDSEKVSANNSILTGTTTISQAVVLSGDISPTALSATTNDWNPTGLSTASVIRVDLSGGSQQLTGLAGGSDGRLITLQNISAFNLYLKNANTGSSASNRFLLSADLRVLSGDAVDLWYDSTSSRWRLAGTVYRGRLIATGSNQFYIRNDGSDLNDGSANDAAHAWLTHQGAENWIGANLDHGGGQRTVNVGPGLYPPFVAAHPRTGTGYIAYQGDAARAITGAVSGTAGVIRLTVSTAGLANGNLVMVRDVGGTTEANNDDTNTVWSINVVDATHLELAGTTFVHTYTSGGSLVTTLMKPTANGQSLVMITDFSILSIVNHGFYDGGFTGCSAIRMLQPSILDPNNCTYGRMSGGVHLAIEAGYLNETGAKWIIGSAATHLNASAPCEIYLNPTVTIRGGLTFTIFASINPFAFVTASATITYSGAGAGSGTTGQKFFVAYLGSLNMTIDATWPGTTAGQNLNVNLGQVPFPATQNPSTDANTLDDYEETSWTPTASFASGGATANYATDGQVGRATKIGNRVYWNAVINFGGSFGAGTGTMTITGLPYTSANVANNYSPVCGSLNSGGASGALAGFIAPNSTIISLTDKNFVPLSNTNVSTSGFIIIGGNYYTG